MTDIRSQAESALRFANETSQYRDFMDWNPDYPGVPEWHRQTLIATTSSLQALAKNQIELLNRVEEMESRLVKAARVLRAIESGITGALRQTAEGPAHQQADKED